MNAPLSFTDAFDTSGALRRPPLNRLPRELLSLVAAAPPQPDPRELPNGQGRAVLVIPAFLTNDGITGRLRSFLDRCGFKTFGWNAGINWGPTEHLLAALRERLAQIRRDSGVAKVSLVGVSLGGLFARDLAHDRPDDIAHVVTVASPFRLPTATSIEPLIRLFIKGYSTKLDLRRLSAPLPVPWTAIYSREDGIVAWESCVSDEPGGVHLEVSAPHLSMCGNAQALRAIVTRLASN